MQELEAKLKVLEAEFKSAGSGYCLLVKIVNYEELYAMLGCALEVVSDMNSLIRKILDKNVSYVHTQIIQSSIFVIIPSIDKEVLKKAILDIHTSSQLYTNDSLREAYIEAKIGLIEFGLNSKLREIYFLLIGLLANNRNKEYYFYEYKEEKYNLEIIKSANKEINELRKAVKNNNLKFVYQPIIDRKTSKPYYHECLLRTQGADGSLKPLGDVISRAEGKGLIYVIDRVVFEMAVKELASSPEDLHLSVNISNIGILDDNLLERVKYLLDKYKISKRLIIEITETTLNEDYKKTKVFMDTLHKLGCRFALDDFGSGFTTFAQLENLPIDIIKIDGSYIKNILQNRSSRYFVEALIKISEEKGIKTVAEFVENGDIAKYLIDKVDGMQGNFFSPAVNNRKDD